LALKVKVAEVGEIPRELMPVLKAQADGMLKGARAPQSQRPSPQRGGFSVEFKTSPAVAFATARNTTEVERLSPALI